MRWGKSRTSASTSRMWYHPSSVKRMVPSTVTAGRWYQQRRNSAIPKQPSTSSVSVVAGDRCQRPDADGPGWASTLRDSITCGSDYTQCDLQGELCHFGRECELHTTFDRPARRPERKHYDYH